MRRIAPRSRRAARPLDARAHRTRRPDRVRVGRPRRPPALLPDARQPARHADRPPGSHDLTIVAAGQGELAALFERDAERSGYHEPQRSVAMVIVKGPALQREELAFFDAARMSETFEQFWTREGAPAYTLTNMMLAPLSRAGRLLLLAQRGSDGVRQDGRQALADLFANGFADPARLVALLRDVPAARRAIREVTGSWWWVPVAGGALRVAAGQLRRLLGGPRRPA